MFNKNELDVLEGVLNEEIISILRSGYGTKNDSVIAMRNILYKLGLKEYYKFEEWDEE